MPHFLCICFTIVNMYLTKQSVSTTEKHVNLTVLNIYIDSNLRYYISTCVCRISHNVLVLLNKDMCTKTHILHNWNTQNSIFNWPFKVLINKQMFLTMLITLYHLIPTMKNTWTHWNSHVTKDKLWMVVRNIQVFNIPNSASL